jgi:hypothetical protein
MVMGKHTYFVPKQSYFAPHSPNIGLPFLEDPPRIFLKLPEVLFSKSVPPHCIMMVKVGIEQTTGIIYDLSTGQKYSGCISTPTMKTLFED